MKRTIATLILLAALTGLVVAQSRADVEAQTITGRIVLEEDTLPVLVSGQTSYDLLIHPSLASEISVQSGETVTVEGYVRETASFDLLGTDNRVMVTAFESGGTRVVLPSGRRGWGRRGGGHRGYGMGGPMGYGDWSPDSADQGTRGRGAR